MNSKLYCIYSTNDPMSSIKRSITCSPDDIQIQLQQNELYIPGLTINDPVECYIPDTTNPVVTSKQVSTIIQDKTTVFADGTDKVTFTNVVIGSEMTIIGVLQSQITTIMTDITLELTFINIDNYIIKFTKLDYTDYTGIINAN